MRYIIFVLVGLLSGCASMFDHKPMLRPEYNEIAIDPRGEPESPRHRVLILPFLDDQPARRQVLSEPTRTVVIRDLKSTRQLVVVPLDEFPQDLKTFLSEENEYDLPRIARAANAMGIAAVVEGKILNVTAARGGDSVGLFRESKATVSAEVRLRAVAGKNAKEVLNETRGAQIEGSATHFVDHPHSAPTMEDPLLARQAVRKAFAQSLPSLLRAVDKLGWEGRVAMVSGERVFVNAGRLSGLQIGDLLKVSEDGDDVYDPESGRFIGTAPGRLKGTVELMSYFGKDGAIGVIHSGSGFSENDRVELY